jgi:anti-anti-sigma factor
MLKPWVQTHNIAGILVAEFWDCLRLDPVPVQDLRNKYEAHLKGGGNPDLVIDLSGVGFAGSAALGNFVALQRLVRQKNGRLLFCNVDPTVAEVFRASKLESLFEFVSDREAAYQAINSGVAAGAASSKAPEKLSPGSERPRTSLGGGLRRLRRKDPERGSGSS